MDRSGRSKILGLDQRHGDHHPIMPYFLLLWVIPIWLLCRGATRIWGAQDHAADWTGSAVAEEAMRSGRSKTLGLNQRRGDHHPRMPDFLLLGVSPNLAPVPGRFAHWGLKSMVPIPPGALLQKKPCDRTRCSPG